MSPDTDWYTNIAALCWAGYDDNNDNDDDDDDDDV